MKLKFAKGNAKLSKSTAIFSLPAGHTCLGARDCLASANRETGKIIDGAGVRFRCYAASGENLFRNVRVSRWRNFDLLKGKTVEGMADLIAASLPRKVTLCRVHASGDFFSQAYFDAWMAVARRFPHIIFYAYTKALPLWVYRRDSIPDNFNLVASKGGKFDAMIARHGLRFVEVVFSEKQAADLHLPIDHDDTLAWQVKGNFALLLHGTQPAGSEASKVLYKLRQQGKGGYASDYFAHYKAKENK